MPTQGVDEAESAAAPTPLRLLLVEDNPDDAMLLERFLRRNGFVPRLKQVETAAELNAALDAEDFEIVIADYNLPRFSGPDALQLVRRRDAEIPFIMMSGAISEETAVESMRSGAQDYVTKQNLARLVPVLERELREAVARRNKVAAERALEASQTRFQHLVAAMPLALLLSDSKGRVLYTNAAAQKLLGYSGASLLSGQVSLQEICPVLQDGLNVQIEPFETICRTAADTTLEVLLGVAPLNPDADRTEQQYAAFLADLTLQKKSEEVLRRTEKLAVAGRLAASIAHEINNPLEAIVNCLYLVSQTKLPPDAQGYLHMAQDELNRVAQITVQTLRFYRRSTQAAHTRLQDLVETVLALLHTRLERQQVEVRREFAAVPDLYVHDGEIRQVVANLLGNAMDAMGEGGTLHLRIRQARSWSTGQPGVRLSVADTGCGMSATPLRRLFEPFFSTKGITGTGLGLWVSREIVDKHHGTLRVQSHQRLDGDAGGTVFSLWLPVDAEPPLLGS